MQRQFISNHLILVYPQIFFLHQPMRFLHSSDQVMHHQPITCILDLILHQIFKTFSMCLPNDLLLLLQSQALLNTMVQSHNKPIPWTQHLGSTHLTRYYGPKSQVQILRTNYHGPKVSFQTYTRFSLHESVCICIRAFVAYNLHVYAAQS